MSEAFRFESFADAASAQAAFEAVHPPGSPITPALQALVDMGAQCRTIGPNRFACRYVEPGKPLAGFCWQVALDSNADRTIERVRIGASLLAA
jgi:hypothetical protein